MQDESKENPVERKPAICKFLDGFIDVFGKNIAWLNIALLVTIIVQVILRYVFGRGVVILEELQWHFYGVMIILAISYTLVHDGHIRLDLLYMRFSKRRKAWVDILGIILLLCPMIIVIFIHGFEFFQVSFHVGESSDSPMGLCCRWAIKGFLPFGMLLLALAAVSRFFNMASFLKRSKKES